MSEVSLTRRVMAGQCAWAMPLRGLLRVCSTGYGAVVALRNRRYDRRRASARIEVPVISVGNITTGGTGKTPLVIAITRLLLDRGLRVAVVSRGYKAGRGRLADELLLLSRRLPDVVCIQDPDRTAAARRAVDEHGAQVIVLDDGFQHRRLGRDLDLVAIDATCPFGFGHLLPRGLLREPPDSLRRADLIVITRADQVDQAALRTLQARLEQIAPGIARLASRHKPAGLARLDGSHDELATLQGRPVICASAIGNPAAFEHTVRQMGADVLCHLLFADHHRYRVRDLARVADLAARHHAEVVLTTEKDSVKMAEVAFDWPCRVAAVRIDIDLLDGADRILRRKLEGILADRGAV